MTRSTIRQNGVFFTTKKGGGSGGGVVIMTGSAVLRESSIDDNYAYSSGGLQIGAGNISLYYSSISENRSFVSGDNTGGGGIVIMKGNVLLDNSRVCNNVTRGMYSGSIVSFLGNVTVIDSEISGNVNRGPGGAIAANFQSVITVTGSRILNNTGASLGGAIVNFSGAEGQITISNSEFMDNVITNYQTIAQTIKAFVNVLTESVNQMTSCGIVNGDSDKSKKTRKGGNPKLKSALSDITRLIGMVDFSKLKGITQGTGGGAIATLLPCSINITGTQFFRNRATKRVTDNRFTAYGGAIFSVTSGVSIQGSDFEENLASTDGSAIFNNGKMVLEDLRFKANEGPHTIVNTKNGYLVLSNVRFDSKSSLDNKGSVTVI